MSSLIEPWLARREEMRQRAVHWLRSPSFQRSYYDDAHPPFAAKILFQQTEKKAEAARLWKKCEIFGIQTPELWAQYQDLANHSQLVFGCVVIANPQLMDAPHRSLPCLLLIPQEQNVFAISSTASMADLLGDIYTGREERYPVLQKLLLDDEFQIFRRRPLERGEISNVDSRLFDVLLRLSWLPPQDMPFVPMLMEPGGKGAIVQIPWSVASGTMPAPDSMPRGIWGEAADLDRAADEQVKQHNARRSGIGHWILRKFQWMLFIGVGYGVIEMVWKPFRPSKPGTSSSPTQIGSERRVVWEQAPDVRRKISVVPATEYEPLQERGGGGRGFLFQVPPGLIVAATSRRQSRSEDLLTHLLTGPEELTVSLSVMNVRKQPKSCVQLVTGVSGKTVALPFRSDDVLQPNDELWLILGKGRHITGNFDNSTPHRIDKPAVRLKFRVATEENIKDTGGLPVIHAKTGRVVGIVQSSDRPQSPTVLIFETISLIPSGG